MSKKEFHALALSDPSINPVKASEELVKAYGHTDSEQWVNPGIKVIVDKLMTVPGAKELVQKTIAEAEQIAAGIEGKQPKQGKAA